MLDVNLSGMGGEGLKKLPCGFDETMRVPVGSLITSSRRTVLKRLVRLELGRVPQQGLLRRGQVASQGSALVFGFDSAMIGFSS